MTVASGLLRLLTVSPRGVSKWAAGHRRLLQAVGDALAWKFR